MIKTLALGLAGFLCLALLTAASVGGSEFTAPTPDEIADVEAQGDVKVTIETDKGSIQLTLDGKRAPMTTANFVKLARAGFYEGILFHRVEAAVVQAGCPQGIGTGGPGYTIELEVHDELRNVTGAVGMARSHDPHSAGSQFYILKVDAPGLDGAYAIFGHVEKGMDVVRSLTADTVIEAVSIEAFE